MRKLSEINEGVFRNSIIRTSGTRLKRREGQLDYLEVDLGLPSGTLWADKNVGAHSVGEYGGYFQWGGTEDMYGKKFDWNNYSLWDGKDFTKYNDTDKKSILELEDDAANVNMGGEWRMPTFEDAEELVAHTTIAKANMEGAAGILFKSKINGNTLFIPAGGFGVDSDEIKDEGMIFSIWTSSSVYDNDKTISYALCSLVKFPYAFDAKQERRFGFPVRGVKGK